MDAESGYNPSKHILCLVGLCEEGWWCSHAIERALMGPHKGHDARMAEQHGRWDVVHCVRCLLIGTIVVILVEDI